MVIHLFLPAFLFALRLFQVLQWASGRAVVNGASQAVSALPGFHPMTQRQRQAYSLRSGGAALSRRALRSLHPGQ